MQTTREFVDSLQCVQTPASVSQLREEYGDKIKEFRASAYSSSKLPASVNWRLEGAVTAVKDQVWVDPVISTCN